MRKITFLLLLAFILTACTPASATQSQLPTNTPEINHIATQEAVIFNQVLAGLPTDKLLAEDPGVNTFSPPTLEMVPFGEILTNTILPSLVYLEESIKSQIPGTASVEFTETTSGDYQAMFLPRDADGNMLWSFVESTNQWGNFTVYHFLDDTGTIDGVVTEGIQYQPIPFSQDAVVVWGPQPIVVKSPLTLEDGTSAYGVYFDFSSGSWAILPDLQVVDGAALVDGTVFVLNAEGGLEELSADGAVSYQLIEGVLTALDNENMASFVFDAEIKTWVMAIPAFPEWSENTLQVESGQIQEKDGLTYIVRGLREGEVEKNVSFEARILFILNEETNQWEMPMPEIEQVYGKDVNPFKTKSFAYEELPEYAPELFAIPSLEPEYLTRWLQQYSEFFIESDAYAAKISISQSYMNEMKGYTTSVPTGNIHFRELAEISWLKADGNSLVLCVRYKMPLGNEQFKDGVLFEVLSMDILNTTFASLKKEWSYSEGIEAALFKEYPNALGFTNLIIGDTANLTDNDKIIYASELKFRDIMDRIDPSLAEDFRAIISAKYEDITEEEKIELVNRTSKVLIPALQGTADPNRFK